MAAALESIVCKGICIVLHFRDLRWSCSQNKVIMQPFSFLLESSEDSHLGFGDFCTWPSSLLNLELGFVSDSVIVGRLIWLS